MKIAVIILNWNGKQLLEQFLPSMAQHSAGATIYVADNASSDDSLEFVAHAFPSIKIIQNKENFGFARGYNEALQFVEEDIYVLVNSDVEVTPNWLNPIVEMFVNEPKTVIIQPKILDFKRKEYFEYAGAGGGFIDQYGYPYCRGRIFSHLEKDSGQYNDQAEIFWASGACFFIRKDTYRDLGGFDNDYFAHQEEIDLCWRAFNQNLVVKYCGTSTVYHVGGATLHSGKPEKTYLNFRNSLAMLIKNVPKRNLFSTLFIRMSLDFIAVAQFVLNGRLPHGYAIFRAHMSIYKNYFRHFRKRGTISDRKYYQLQSIVFQFYIRRKRLYKNLF